MFYKSPIVKACGLQIVADMTKKTTAGFMFSQSGLQSCIAVDENGVEHHMCIGFRGDPAANAKTGRF